VKKLSSYPMKLPASHNLDGRPAACRPQRRRLRQSSFISLACCNRFEMALCSLATNRFVPTSPSLALGVLRNVRRDAQYVFLLDTARIGQHSPAASVSARKSR